MDSEKTAIAEACLHGAESGSMHFPQIEYHDNLRQASPPLDFTSRRPRIKQKR